MRRKELILGTKHWFRLVRVIFCFISNIIVLWKYEQLRQTIQPQYL